MNAIVVPAQNEAPRLGKVLNNLLLLPETIIIVVANGCIDQTVSVAQNFLDRRIKILEYPISLGIDIPRALGTIYALHLGADQIAFVDGDMTGYFNEELLKLFTAIANGQTDLALTNCYPYISRRNELAAEVLYFREKLNRELGIFNEIGLASPSHGPHAISRKLAIALPLEALAIPPIEMVMAQQMGFGVSVIATISHKKMQSPNKGPQHARLVAQTIVGDCLEAIWLNRGLPRSRAYKGKEFNGYHPERRFDMIRG